MALPLPKRVDHIVERSVQTPLEAQTSNPWRTARVIATLSPRSVKVTGPLQAELVAVASHVPMPMPGQQVLIASADGAPGLVIAAYPMAQEHAATSQPHPERPLIEFDEQSGTLCVHAHQLKLHGLGLVELHCGDAVLRLNAQGELFSHAQAITQSAIGAHRIEGASVDIN